MAAALVVVRSSVICAWGESGAAARTHEGPTVTCPSVPPSKVVDTLGAGDTFIAATISVLSDTSRENPDDDETGESHNARLKRAIEFGCHVAGAKCGMQGFDGIREMFTQQ